MMSQGGAQRGRNVLLAGALAVSAGLAIGAVRLVSAAQPFASDPNRRLTIYNGVLQIHSSSGAKVLELGNETGTANSNILSTGRIYLRPGDSVAPNGSSGAGSYFSTPNEGSADQNLVLTGSLCLGDELPANCKDSWSGVGGGSLWTDGGAFTYLTQTNDNVVIGDATDGQAGNAEFVFDLDDGSNNPFFMIRDKGDVPANVGANIYLAHQTTLGSHYNRLRLEANEFSIYHPGTAFPPGAKAIRFYNDDIHFHLADDSAASSFFFQTQNGSLLAKLRDGGLVPEFGIRTDAPEGSLVVASHNVSNNPIGQAENAISAYANEPAGGPTGSAIYAEQGSVIGYAGYFGGRLLANNGGTPAMSTNDAFAAYANTTGNAIFAQQQNQAGYAGFFLGKLGVFDGASNGGGTLQVGVLNIGGRSNGGLPPSPEGDARPWTSFSVFQSEWSFRVSNPPNCSDSKLAEATANNGFYLRFQGPVCNDGVTSYSSMSPGTGIALEPNEYVLVVRARVLGGVLPNDHVMSMIMLSNFGAETGRREVYGRDFNAGGAWTTLSMPFRHNARASAQYSIQPELDGGKQLDLDYYAVYPAPVDSFVATSQKVCSCVSPGNWRSMTVVPGGWTTTTCNNWCISPQIGGSSSNNFCLNETGYSFTATDCGW